VQKRAYSDDSRKNECEVKQNSILVCTSCTVDIAIAFRNWNIPQANNISTTQLRYHIERNILTDFEANCKLSSG